MIKLDETSKEFADIEKGWYDEVKTITSKNRLDRFVKKVLCGYEHDYGTYVKAVAVCTKAFIRYYGSAMTGYQASFLMWELVRHTFNNDDKFGMQLVRFENVLYPQMLFTFEVEFDEEIHEKVIAEAKKLLEEDKTEKVKASKDVKAHWEKLASGWLPKCIKLKVKEEKPNANA